MARLYNGSSSNQKRRYISLTCLRNTIQGVSLFALGFGMATTWTCSTGTHTSSIHTNVLLPESSSSLTNPCESQLQGYKSKNQQLELELKELKAELDQTNKELKERETKYVPRFDESTGYAHGMARMSKEEFVSVFDYGTPTDGVPNNEGSHDVLLLYNSKAALPKDDDLAHLAGNSRYGITSSTGSKDTEERKGHIPMMDVDTATENCDYLTVATVPSLGMNKKGLGQCMALVRNLDNWHLQKWLRVPQDDVEEEEEGGSDVSLPLRLVSRMHSIGSEENYLPRTHHINSHWERLQQYFETLEIVLSDLRPIAERVAVNNAIIVMTCNFGQSELLINFVCNARAKGLPLGNILVFPTDEKTDALAQALGLATFSDLNNLKGWPTDAAEDYGDQVFGAMMFAKVLCVQLVNHLGYDVLFQDVDVIWYKNPLSFFQERSSEANSFDLYFQDDGARSDRYTPTSCNSGFYYVVNNSKTKYLFISLLYHGDMIVASKSHQHVLVQLMAEHVSLFGLRVKVLGRYTDMLPSGHHFHRDEALMKKIVQKEVIPEIFHMSWTTNKENKKKFFEQLGEWYAKDECIGKEAKTILDFDGAKEKSMDTGAASITSGGIESGALVSRCCVREAKAICHYKDKPSKVPCKDSPAFEDRDGDVPSFW